MRSRAGQRPVLPGTKGVGRNHTFFCLRIVYKSHRRETEGKQRDTWGNCSHSVNAIMPLWDEAGTSMLVC